MNRQGLGDWDVRYSVLSEKPRALALGDLSSGPCPWLLERSRGSERGDISPIVDKVLT